MSEWMVWFGLAGALVIFEMATGTFYLLMLACGFAAGGVAAMVGADVELQLLCAAIVGAIATYSLRRSRFGKGSSPDAAHDPNVNLDIGQRLAVDAWNGGDSDVKTARAMYRGAMWDVELQSGGKAVPGQFVIREVRGSRLIVENGSSNQ